MYFVTAELQNWQDFWAIVVYCSAVVCVFCNKCCMLIMKHLHQWWLFFIPSLTVCHESHSENATKFSQPLELRLICMLLFRLVQPGTALIRILNSLHFIITDVFYVWAYIYYSSISHSTVISFICIKCGFGNTGPQTICTYTRLDTAVRAC